MVNIAVRSIVERCVTNDDGDKLFIHIYGLLQDGVDVCLSFDGVGSVSSSFVNSAFIKLLEFYSFDAIKKHLVVTNSNAHINSVIKRRFQFETNKTDSFANKDCCSGWASCASCP